MSGTRLTEAQAGGHYSDTGCIRAAHAGATKQHRADVEAVERLLAAATRECVTMSLGADRLEHMRRCGRVDGLKEALAALRGDGHA